MKLFSKFTVLIIAAFIAVIIGLISGFEKVFIWDFLLFLAISFVAIVLIERGIAALRNSEGEIDYFTAAGALRHRDTHDSIGSTWIMLGNVIVANMYLGQLFGAVTLWMLVTWGWAFFVLSHHVKAIRECPKPAATLHAFLHDAYSSRAMQIVAALITVFTGIGVFAIEVLVGISLIIGFTPNAQPWVVALSLGAISIIAMIIATMTGGLRAIVESDSLLWRIVLLATLLLPAVVFFSDYQDFKNNFDWGNALLPSSLNTSGVVAFIIGIFLLQVPLLIGDYGTWQRIRATDLKETTVLSKKLFSLGGMQILLWGAPVLAGMLLLKLPPIDNGRSGPLYSIASPLIELARHWGSAPAIAPFARTAVAFVIVLGLISVMVTTADGYLMITLEAWVRDFSPTNLSETNNAKRARRFAIVFGVAALLPVFGLVKLGGSLLALISIFFGALVSLSAPTLLALYFPLQAFRWRLYVVVATFLGFLSTIMVGIIVTFFLPDSSYTEWWHTYGIFLIPVPAILFPLFTILAKFLLEKNVHGAFVFFMALFSPFPVKVAPVDEEF